MKNVLIIYLLFTTVSFSQNLINGDLEGPSGSFISSLLPGWDFVPYDDPNCLAISGYAATPDVLDELGPNMNNGLFGMPHSGNTFISGRHTDEFQEGIMQTVSGFEIGKEYIISFYQSNVKQYNESDLDTTGSWAVYIDSLLADYSIETLSHDPAIHLNLNWEFREISFIATANTHTLKFLPIDLDTNNNLYDEGGSLRMGIDKISVNDFSQLGMLSNPLIKHAIRSYPNPFLDNFILDIEVNEVKSLTLYSLDNKEYELNVVSENNKLHIYPLNTSPGVYFLLVKLVSGKEEFIKVISN